jgi:hypothetical protein
MHSVVVANKGITMRTLPMTAIALAVIFTAGCNNAKSPDAVSKDVAVAEQKATNEVAKSETNASKDIDKAADKVGDKLVDLNNTVANDAYSVAVTKAEGDRKIALAECNSQSGDAQKNCKKQADADYDAAKANAKAAQVAQKQ